MNKAYFKRYHPEGFWEPIEVMSDGEIQKDKGWAELDFTVNGMKCVSVYQCYNPEICVKEYLHKQEMADILREQLEEIKAEQSILKRLLGSKLPIDQPVLFGDIVAVMDEDGVVLFQKAILPSEL